MKKFRILTLAVILLAFSSCSRHIHLNYQLESTNTGKIVLKSSKPTEKTAVAINGYEIIKKKKVKTVTINNVPAGDHTIRYASLNKWYKERLDVQIPVKVENGKEVTTLVDVPPYSTGYWFYIAGQAVLSAAIGLVLK